MTIIPACIYDNVRIKGDPKPAESEEPAEEVPTGGEEKSEIPTEVNTIIYSRIHSPGHTHNRHRVVFTGLTYIYGGDPKQPHPK